MMYKIIDRTKDRNIWKKLKDDKNPIAACILDTEKLITVGDMFWLRDLLIEKGYILWKDFAIKKVEEEEESNEKE